MKKIVIFASGSGSNAEKIILHFKTNRFVNVVGVFTNNKNAKVLEKAKNNNVEAVIFSKDELYDGFVLHKLNEMQPDLIVLAGFLLKFPTSILENFPNKVINIHPALLPKYGGKGMYGINIHKSVFENKEVESGITIHYVNENYDEGEFIFQQSINIEDCQSANEIANKILLLEHEFFPEVIHRILKTETHV